MKYFDHKNNRPLDLQHDGCDLADWAQLHGTAKFAKHPKDFMIFLAPEELDVSDEYAGSDPYTVEQNINNEFHERRISLTLKLLREGIKNKQGKIRVLDLGCGQGHITEKIRLALPDEEITGLDYSVSAIEYARDHFPEIDFAVGNAYKCPYSNEYFDMVVCNNLWEHVPDPLLLLNQMSAVLKPGGSLIVSTPSRYRLNNLVKILLGKPVVFMSDQHITEYTVGQVIEQLRYGGFTVTQMASKPIKLGSIKAELVRWLISKIISLVGSHHQLESTIFYLAQKQTIAVKQNTSVEPTND